MICTSDAGNKWDAEATGKWKMNKPAGWHLPKLEEFDKMINLVGGWNNRKEIISLLRSDSLWEKGFRSSDECGFSIKPAGRYSGKPAEEESYGKSLFEGMNFYSYFWTQTLMNPLDVETVVFAYRGPGIIDHYNSMSIRCIKD